MHTTQLPIDQIEAQIESEIVEESGPPKAEGKLIYFYGKRYERKPKLRKQAIEKHGLTCKVCEFNFEKAYGTRGSGFIEIHHVKPLSSLQGVEQHVDPVSDMVPLCANCHRMIHADHNNILTVDELKRMYEQAQENRLKN